MLNDWLDASLTDTPPLQRDGPLRGGRYVIHAPGILELIPAQHGPAAHAAVISVGIHGNETAPIELLGASLARLEAGLLRLGAPLLVILGNLEALRRGTRYVDTNLNRLFRRDLTESGAEPDRARQLMAAVDAFLGRHRTLPALHYDLHTAIRTSRYPRFAVDPFAAAPVDSAQWRWLAAADIQAVLHQHQHSWTFSHYTKHYHAAHHPGGAAAFTVELGQVQPFGANDLAPLAPMGQLLAALIEGTPPAEAPAERMAFFRVAHELRRHAEAFRFCFPEATPNFTEFPPGTRLAEDALAGPFQVGDRPLRVVFPNARVELGARAALLVEDAPTPR